MEREKSFLINHDWLIQGSLISPLAPSLFMAWLWRCFPSLIAPPSHPSLPFSTFFLHISVAFPCACLFIHPLEKEAVNLAPAPPCLLTHIPSSLPTFIHLSPIHHCLSFSPLSSLFSLALSSHSFSLERFRKMHLRSFFFLSFFKAFLYLS